MSKRRKRKRPMVSFGKLRPGYFRFNGRLFWKRWGHSLTAYPINGTYPHSFDADEMVEPVDAKEVTR